ncbi:MAG: DUF4345 domain-containing protein [Eudoraea sp.]|uniref:DUF4345 domain-containing protein n=1 Tax=Eudoraea sp. TaxID=1979955 RepID=UPI003C716B3C
MNKPFVFKNLHLIISLLVVVPAALIYGLSPSKSLPLLFDFEVASVDLKSVFRAIMGLYLCTSAVWILGILKNSFWNTATILNLVFMGGLGLGRLVGIILDGIPSPAFALGTVGELTLAIFAFYQFKKNVSSKSD